MKKIVVCLFAISMLNSLAAETLDLNGSKDDAASNLRTYRFFSGMGLDVKSKYDEGFTVRSGGYNIMIYPQATRDTGDLIVASIAFPGAGKSNCISEDLQMIIGNANSNYNYMTCFVDDDGDIVLRYTLLFDKTLEPKTVNKWLKRIEVQTDNFTGKFGNRLRPFLKK